MIEYVVEESVRPDGAIRWVVTDLRGMSAGNPQEWSCMDEAEALTLAAARATPNGFIRVGTRDGRHRDYGTEGARQRADDLKLGAAAGFTFVVSGNTPPGAYPRQPRSWVNSQPAPHRPTATLMGVLFIMSNGGARDEFWWSDADQAWLVHQDTYDAMRAGGNTEVQRQIAELRKARMEARPVVKAQVTNNPRRPQGTPRQRKGDLSDLMERTKRMVVQIATMSDKGAIPDGQVAELSKTYAALQAEFDEAMGCAEAIKDNLSIMRAIMFEHSDPRNARDAIA